MFNTLRQLDLNLLITLDILLAELNVTRAAQRLHLSQPTVSIQLARLRAFFDDPLLLPGPRGMQPTARAEQLREPLREALKGLSQVVAPANPFDPATAQQTWRIAAFDYGEYTILLPALAGLRRMAPGLRLAVEQCVPSAVQVKAHRGDIDLAFVTDTEATAEMRSKKMFTERYVLAGGKGHPGLETPPDVIQFAGLEQAIVSPEGGGFQGVTDRILAEQGLTRQVVLSVPHFLALNAVLATTELVAIVPLRMVQGHPDLQFTEPPVAIPGFDMLMVWPERLHRSPAHQWLRQQISGAVQADCTCGAGAV